LPPAMLVPPSATAVMKSSSYPVAATVDALDSLPARISPLTPISAPLMA
jgi:hypothetical protein